MEKITHSFAPVYDCQSRVLILGTMPSPKSRANGFYYSHPQNRFWRIMGDIFDQLVPDAPEQKRDWLMDHRIALWDVLHSCDITGADDSSIRNPVPNDLTQIINYAPIQAIFTTGTKAAALYKRFCLPSIGMEAIALPSTSPANCRFYRYEQLLEQYQIIKTYLDEGNI